MGTRASLAESDTAGPALRDLRRRIAVALLLHLSIRLLVAWILVVGTVVVIMRSALGLSWRPLLLPAVLGLVAAIAAAALLARRRVPSAERLAAFLDDRQRLGGLLVAAAETELGTWQQRLQAISELRVRWRPGPWGLLLGCALLYLLAASVVPLHGPWGSGRQTLDLSSELQQLDTAVEVLTEIQVIEPEAAEQLRQALQEVATDTSADDPAEAFETLDRTAGEVERLADEAVEEMLRQEQQLRQAEALSQALRGDVDALSRAGLDELNAVLSELVEGLRSGDGPGDDALSQELAEARQQAAGSGSLPPELLERLQQALGDKRSELLARLEELQRIRLVDASLVKQCKGCGKPDGKELLAFLADNAGEEGDAAAALAAFCASPGRGGVSRGRGDAPMTWSDGSDPAGVQFKEQVLPPAALPALREARLVGISGTAPETGEEAVPVTGSVLAGDDGQGGSAVRRRLLPRHRRAVQRYFARDSAAGTTTGATGGGTEGGS